MSKTKTFYETMQEERDPYVIINQLKATIIELEQDLEKLKFQIIKNVK
tara:strand:- start:5162 stop:5305 length:144 start_codon:yes stop_codon:yes gene_type:complete